MFFKKLFILSALSISLLSFEPRALSYNFLYINPTTGAPIGWEPGTTIHYYVDPGSLGRLTNEQARTLIRAAMDIWENASPYANTPRFVYEGLLPEDVTGENYQDYVDLNKCYTHDLSLCPSQAQRDLRTVIIFDEDDSILGDICTLTGCSAYAAAGVLGGTSANPTNISQSFMVLGSFAGAQTTKINEGTMGNIIHELGHVLGLAHSSINEDAYINDRVGYGKYMPTMFFASRASSNLNPVESSSTLNPDDISGIATLYPSSNFSENTGTISGRIMKSDGTQMTHVNVIVRDLSDPLCNAYSFVSGRFCQHTTIGEYCIEDNGNYIISGLSPSSYILEVEEVAETALARSLAPGVFGEFIYGDAEFWNESDDAVESSTISSTIDLTAGDVKENINITLNRSAVTEERIKYIPLSTFTAGPDTRCPTLPSIDYAALIGISESIGGTSGTGGIPDSSSSSGGSGGAEAALSSSSGCSLIIPNF